MIRNVALSVINLPEDEQREEIACEYRADGGPGIHQPGGILDPVSTFRA